MKKALDAAISLVPSWNCLSECELSDFSIEPVLGGMSNRLYSIQCDCANVLPAKVVVRVLSVPLEDVVDREVETQVLESLGGAGIAPTYFGTVNGMRVEAFLNGRNLQIDDFADEGLQGEIAKIWAKLHALQPPLSWEEPGIHVMLTKFCEGALKTRNHTCDDIQAGLVNLHKRYDLVTEVQWMIGQLAAHCTDIVLCHNDANENNWFLRKSDNRLFLIDYEYASYNYRA